MNPTPSLKDFVSQARKGFVVPISMRLPADLETPVSVFLKLARKKNHAFLLESVEFGEKLGRYSLIGMDPECLIEYSGRTARVRTPYATKRIQTPLLDAVKMQMSGYRMIADASLPPLVGSFVGYIGYELVQQFETIRLRNKQGLSVPDSIFFLPRSLVVFDHMKHRLDLIHLAIPQGSPLENYRRSLSALHHMAGQLRRVITEQASGALFESRKLAADRLQSNVSRAHFEKMVKKAKAYIRAGDCIQVVLSQRFELGTVRDDFALYRTLRSLNPSPYLFYFKSGDLTLVGSSPEMFAKKARRIAGLRPIAGTRPRGENRHDDLVNEAALRNSSKEKAEHLMLVDLGRNDLGRVCKSSSVRVEAFARIERFSHVMHLVSDVSATLKDGKTAFDLMRAAFPAGTVTGAPKIRAMEIIDELEHERRGPYAGSLGYFSLNGDMDMCITIRTIVIHKRRAYVQAGAGIVNDSKPKKEYRETIHKAQALFQAAGRGRQ